MPLNISMFNEHYEFLPKLSHVSPIDVRGPSSLGVGAPRHGGSVYMYYYFLWMYDITKIKRRNGKRTINGIETVPLV